MTLLDAGETIDRLVADLARATGRPETLVRLSYGLPLDEPVVVEAVPDAA